MPKDADVKTILNAGIWAPSGLNNQPWKFKVLKKGEGKDEIARFTKYGDIIKRAPVGICVFLDKKTSYNREKDIMAIGACIQNMLLQVYELGLAACWLGEILNRKQDLKKHLKVGPDCELMAVVTLGYADEEEEGERKDIRTFLLK